MEQYSSAHIEATHSFKNTRAKIISFCAKKMCRKFVILIAFAVYLVGTRPSTSAQNQFRRTSNANRMSPRSHIFTEDLTCYSNASYVHNQTCYFWQVAQERTAILIKFFLIKPCNEIEARVKLYYLYTTEERLLFDKWENICAYMDGKARSFLLDYFMPKFVEYSKFNHSCPYSGDLIFKADRMAAGEVLANEILPTGQFRLEVTLTNGPHRSFVIGLIDKFSNVLHSP